MTRSLPRWIFSGFLLPALALLAGAQQTPPPSRAVLADASAAEEQQDDIAARLERDVIVPLRQERPGATILPIEYSSERVREILPRCRIFIAAGAWTDQAGPYIFDGSGTMWNLGGRMFSFPDGAAFADNKVFADLIISQDVIVEDEAGAIKVGRLVDEIALCEIAVRQFHQSTRGLTLYDPKRLSWVSREEDPRWQDKACRVRNVWLVTRQWDQNGPPASTMVQPIWAIETDGKGKVTKLRQLVKWWGLPKEIDEAEFERLWEEEGGE